MPRQMTHKQVRTILRGDEKAIGLTLAGTEHVFAPAEAKDLASSLSNAAFWASEHNALRSEIMRLRDRMRGVLEADGIAQARQIARETLSDE